MNMLLQIARLEGHTIPLDFRYIVQNVDASQPLPYPKQVCTSVNCVPRKELRCYSEKFIIIISIDARVSFSNQFCFNIQVKSKNIFHT